MNQRITLVAVVLSVSLWFTACSQTGSPPVPTNPPAAAAPTKAPAAAPTSAPQPAATAAPKASFPEKGKAINFIVPWAAGGPADVGARLLAEGMKSALGVPVQIINKVGASGQVGMTELAQAKPDGYTIGLFVNPPSATVYMDPERKAIYNLKSFEFIASHAMDIGTVAVKADSPYKTIKDLVDAAKARPGEVKIGTAGVLAIGHLAGLMLQKESGAKFGFVHMEGGPQVITAMLGGNVDAAMETGSIFLPQAKAGGLRVIGVMDTQESRFYPGVQTMEAQGYKVYFAMSRGVVAPAGTPKEIVNILADAIKKTVGTDDHKQKMEAAAIPIRYMEPADYGAYCLDLETQVKPLLQLAKEK